MIGVCGSGSWGTALACVLARNISASIMLWGRDTTTLDNISKCHENVKYFPGVKLPDNLVACMEISTLVQQNQDILIAVPSSGFCYLLEQMGPHLNSSHRIVWATKGLEPKRGRFFHQVVVDKLGDEQIYGVLSGPSFAAEVMQELPTAITISTNNANFTECLVKYFHSDTFRVYASDDLMGIQLGGVIKNILAVATGISDGLGFGANARAALITRGLAEMMRLGDALGAKPETFTGLAGIGDMLLTCTDNKSRNRRFGLALAKGISIEQAQSDIGQVVESVHNAVEICHLAKKYKIDMPITQQIKAILQNEISPQDAVINLISRKPTAEYI